MPLGDKQVDIVFTRFDVDRSGTIDYDEWIDMMNFQSREDIMDILTEIRFKQNLFSAYFCTRSNSFSCFTSLRFLLLNKLV